MSAEKYPSLLYGLLRERARQTRSRAAGLATRAGKMELSCPLGTTCCIPQAKFHQEPYNKSFIDQVCSVKMAGYWPRSFFLHVYQWAINTQIKNLANIYPAILTSHLVNNPYIFSRQMEAIVYIFTPLELGY